MKIDLHVHSSDRSGCGVNNDDEMIQAAIARGLDALCFTDHDRFVPPERLAELNARHAPFRVFGGIEVVCEEDEHILLFGVREPDLEKRRWPYAELHALARAQGGCLALAHPFRFHPGLNVDAERWRPDLLEVRSTNMLEGAGPRDALLARLGCRPLHASDAHSVERVGLFYVELERPPADEGELAAQLRAGAYRLDEDGAEELEIVNERGEVVGRAPRRLCHANPSLVHRAVHVLVFDKEGRLLLQKRPAHKDIQPGKWDSSVGGHVKPGEHADAAALREAAEELGLEWPRLEFLYEYVWRSDRETEQVRTYRARADGPFRRAASEVADLRFWTRAEIEEHLGTGVFTPNFEHEFERLKACGALDRATKESSLDGKGCER